MPNKMVAPGQRGCEKNAPMKMPKAAEQHQPTKKRESALSKFAGGVLPQQMERWPWSP